MCSCDSSHVTATCLSIFGLCLVLGVCVTVLLLALSMSPSLARNFICQSHMLVSVMSLSTLLPLLPLGCVNDDHVQVPGLRKLVWIFLQIFFKLEAMTA